jgi:peptidoglycan/LPS O-acetylase OafA/YrhL
VVRCGSTALRDDSTIRPTSADSLLFGVILGFLAHYHRETFAKIASAWPALALAVVPVLTLAYLLPLDDPGTTFAYTLGFTLLYLGFGALVVIAGAYPSAGERNLAARTMAWMGVYSYTIYLTHSVILLLPGAWRLPAFVRQQVLDSPWVDRVLFWGLSIATGYIVSRLIERPFLELRKRWLPSARPHPPRSEPPPLRPRRGQGRADPGDGPGGAVPTMKDRRRNSRAGTHQIDPRGGISARRPLPATF